MNENEFFDILAADADAVLIIKAYEPGNPYECDYYLEGGVPFCKNECPNLAACQSLLREQKRKHTGIYAPDFRPDF